MGTFIFYILITYSHTIFYTHMPLHVMLGNFWPAFVADDQRPGQQQPILWLNREFRVTRILLWNTYAALQQMRTNVDRCARQDYNFSVSPEATTKNMLQHPTTVNTSIEIHLQRRELTYLSIDWNINYQYTHVFIIWMHECFTLLPDTNALHGVHEQ